VKNIIPEHNIALISLLKDTGIEIRQDGTSIEIDASNQGYLPIQADALPYPGMPSDVQPLLSALAVLCKGVSVIKDTVFVDRFQYVSEYKKMGIDIFRSYNHVYICGPQRVQGAAVTGEDIRTATSLALAALSADGKTILYGYEHIRRGYEDFDKKMNSLGAKISLEIPMQP
jgi:UDP-N-acetylglucosamine 1-carboxyvinyltransferase